MQAFVYKPNLLAALSSPHAVSYCTRIPAFSIYDFIVHIAAHRTTADGGTVEQRGTSTVPLDALGHVPNALLGRL